MNAVKGFLANPAYVRKSIAALVASALLLIASHQLPDAVGLWIAGFQPLLVAYGVWQVPNVPVKAPPEPPKAV